MKNFLLFTALIILCKHQVLAQTIGITPHLGFNLCPQPKSTVFGNQFNGGFNGGIAGRYALKPWLSVKAELNYTGKTKVYKYHYSESAISVLSNYLGFAIDTSVLNTISGSINDTVYSAVHGIDRLKFVEFPVSANFHYKNFDFGVGGYATFLFGASSNEELTQKSGLLDLLLPVVDTLQGAGPLFRGLIESSFPGYAAPYQTSTASITPFRRIDYGMMLELTYHSSDRVMFNARYTRGFVNYRKVGLRSDDLYNTITFSIGYTFGTVPGTKLKGIYDLDKVPVAPAN